MSRDEGRCAQRPAPPQPLARGTDPVKMLWLRAGSTLCSFSPAMRIPAGSARAAGTHRRGAAPRPAPGSGGRSSQADALEELYELAQRTGAEAEYAEEYVGGLWRSM
ncbi:MAG: hypothetical protein WAV83_07965 [Methanothrix sp.]|uniref:hypothetical protein n=1 Tax=Methanothrix sp. TaxID=90426 RepID=UPI003BB121DA